MNAGTQQERMLPPMGLVEPHSSMLSVPPDSQLLYKIVSVENLLQSIQGDYLHFNRVDCYKDFSGADPHDGRQLPQDYAGNARSKFQSSADFSAANYYDHSRARTYACCFSLENTDYIWNNYANGSEKGKVCLVFNFGKLRATLNKMLQPGQVWLFYNGVQCHQIFSVNYGIVEYVEISTHQANAERLPNPIIYTYLKDKSFAEEKELRISMSAAGVGQFFLSDNTLMEFPSSLKLAFNFRAAIADKTLQNILFRSGTDTGFLKSELEKLHISLANG